MTEWFIASRKKMAEDIALKAMALDHSGEMVIIHDFEGNLIYVNQACCDSRDLSKAELMSLNLLDLLNIEDKEKFYFTKLREIRLNKQLKFEFTNYSKNGELQRRSVNAKVITINSEKAIMSSIRDITEQWLIEQELRNTVLKYKSLVESTVNWIFEIDEEYRFLFSNCRVKEILGYEVDEILGLPLCTILFSYVVEKMKIELRKIKESLYEEPTPAFLHHLAVHRNGDILRLETTFTAFQNSRGEIFFRGLSIDRERLLSQAVVLNE